MTLWKIGISSYSSHTLLYHREFNYPPDIIESEIIYFYVKFMIIIYFMGKCQIRQKKVPTAMEKMLNPPCQPIIISLETFSPLWHEHNNIWQWRRKINDIIHDRPCMFKEFRTASYVDLTMKAWHTAMINCYILFIL